MGWPPSPLCVLAQDLVTSLNAAVNFTLEEWTCLEPFLEEALQGYDAGDLQVPVRATGAAASAQMDLHGLPGAGPGLC